MTYRTALIGFTGQSAKKGVPKSDPLINGMKIAIYSTIMRQLFFSLIIICNIISSAILMASDIPDIARVQQKALSYARLKPNQISKWRKSAKIQAWLPQLQLDYSHKNRSIVDVDISDSVYVGSGGITVGPDEGSMSYDQQGDQSIGVKAVWRLNESLFNSDTINISAESRRLSQERQALLMSINEHYFSYKRALIEGDFLNAHYQKAAQSKKNAHLKLIQKQMQADEAKAALDALTGGWFSRQLD